MRSPVAQGKTSGRITEIDTFRAWAVLSVLIFHYAKEFYPGAGILISVRLEWG